MGHRPVSDTLLLFLSRQGGFDGWVHVDDGIVARTGIDLPDLPVTPGANRSRLAAIVPGEEVTIHWIDMPPGLSLPQAAAAARLAVADLAADPVETLHVAVGRETEDGRRAVAVARADQVRIWLDTCSAAGIDPDLLVPEPLLLLPSTDGLVRFDRGDVALFRGRDEAFAAEEAIAALLVRDRPVDPIDAVRFEAELPGALAALPLDLRQGAFAKRRHWTPDWRTIRRIALLALALLGATIVLQVATIVRYTLAADRLDQEMRTVAASAVPGAATAADPNRVLARRLAELQGSGVGFGSVASSLFAAVRDTPNLELTAILFDAQGEVRATAIADTPATIAALTQRLEASGFSVSSGPLKPVSGRQVAELTVRSQ